MHLIVTQPFGGREIGDRITDPQTVSEVLDGGNVHHVVQVADDGAAAAPEETEE